MTKFLHLISYVFISSGTAVANIEVKCSEDHEKINGNVCGEKSLNYDDLTDFIL